MDGFFSFLIAINVYYYPASRHLFSSSELEMFLLCSLRFRGRRSHRGGLFLHRGPFLRWLRYVKQNGNLPSLILLPRALYSPVQRPRS